MDPISAFSLAGTILQFIDSGVDFVKLACSLYRSGSEAVTNIQDYTYVTESLSNLLPKLQTPISGGETEKGLAKLAQQCTDTTAKLLSLLYKVKPKDIGRKRDALRTAFRMMFKENEIESLQGRLSSIRAQLNVLLLQSIREHASTMVLKQEETLQKLNEVYKKTVEIDEKSTMSTSTQEESCARLDAIHKETLNVRGLAASILHYLVLQKQMPGRVVEDIKGLQLDLSMAIYDTRIEPNPATIQLSDSDLMYAQSRFLLGLGYIDMVDRVSRIAPAHESTFQWVFNDADQEPAIDDPSRIWREPNFREWLRSEDQLYWITGKAGSGKSTLMKFLSDKQPSEARTSSSKDEGLNRCEANRGCRCSPYLTKWAGSSRLVTASFYFWNSGANIQMTQSGLFRSLLHQIVAACPEVIPELLAPRQWEALCVFDIIPEVKSAEEFREMLFQAIGILRKDSKICLFIDGLDEFDGNHEDLIYVIRGLMKIGHNIKICVASRSWNVFQDAFGKLPNLRLEDLTYHDIKSFVQSKFESDAKFQTLRKRYSIFADQLIENIVIKASGVFLWVDLVVASLLAGMSLGDRIEDFQRRLDELPSDLENLYEKILLSLDKFYLSHAVQYFALVEAAEAPLTILQFSFADEGSPGDAVRMKVGPLPAEEISLQIQAMSRRLNSRCKGFLEVERGLQAFSYKPGSPHHHGDLTVQYLHRTVRDFIKSPMAQNFLQSATKSNFDPCLQLCVAYLMDLKSSDPPPLKLRVPAPRFTLPSYRKGEITVEPADEIIDLYESSPHGGSSRLTLQVLRSAGKALQLNDVPIAAVMNELDHVINLPGFRGRLINDYGSQKLTGSANDELSKGIRSWLRNDRRRLALWSLSERGSFVSLACSYDVVPYVRSKATRGCFIPRPFLPESSWPLLLDAVRNNEPSPEMVKCLLELGADPNYIAEKTTPWIEALSQMSILYTIKELNSPKEYAKAEANWKEILRLMAMAGADISEAPKARLTAITRKVLEELKSEIPPSIQKRNRERRLGSGSWGGWFDMFLSYEH